MRDQAVKPSDLAILVQLRLPEEFRHIFDGVESWPQFDKALDRLMEVADVQG